MEIISLSAAGVILSAFTGGTILSALAPFTSLSALADFTILPALVDFTTLTALAAGLISSAPATETYLPAFVTGTYLPVFIFLARIVDVSMGTLRIMFVSKGYRGISTILSFFEILIWVVVIVQMFQNLDNWINIFAYAGGFAAGTYVGLLIEDRMQMGLLMYRIITNKPAAKLLEEMINAGFRVTSLDAEGAHGPVKILFTIMRRKRKKELAELLKIHAPNSFYSVEDVKNATFLEHDFVMTYDLKTRLLKLKKSF